MSKIFGSRKALRDISKFELITMLAALIALNALAIDIMLPALPQIAQTFSTANANDQQLIISAYMIGVGLSILFFGPISDRYGRRAPLIIGFFVYILASLAAIIAPNFASLLLLRFIQGLGTAVFRIVAMAVMRDKYEGRAMAEVMSLVYMVFMIVPIIAPGIGQLILFGGSWQLIFVFVATVGIIVGIWAYFRLPETLDPKNVRPLTIPSIFGGFKIVISNRFSFSYALAGIGVIMATASFINSRIVKTIGMRIIAHISLIIFILSSLTLAILSQITTLSFIVFYSLMGVIFFMFSLSTSNMNSLSMQPLGKVAGTAASAFGFVQTLGGAIIGLIIGQMYNGSVTPLVSGFTIAGSTALALVLYAEKGKLFGTSED